MDLVIKRPALCRQEVLSLSLIQAIENEALSGQQLKMYGSFIASVPMRIGHSIALDRAVACVVAAHSALIRNEPLSQLDDSHQYVKALCSPAEVH